jgi:hypothetical protein
MNKQLLFALFTFASASTAVAQPTLTAATNNPVIGNLYIEHKADTAGKTPGPSGANVTWNFSTLTEVERDTTRFISCAATPMCDSFPGANIVAYNSNGYLYAATSTAGYKLLGGYHDTTIMHFSDPQNMMSYPVTYNTVQKDTVVTAVPAGGLPVDIVRYDNILADGYGTLKLPSGNYANVLRLHMTSMDVLMVTLPDTILSDTSYSESYAWYASGFHSPLLTMNIDSAMGVKSVSGMSWFSKPGTVATNVITRPGAGITVFPNPATRDINIDYNSLASGLATVTLKDLTGRTTISWSEHVRPDINRLHYTLPQLPEGMYVLSIQTENDIISEKIMISK